MAVDDKSQLTLNRISEADAIEKAKIQLIKEKPNVEEYTDIHLTFNESNSHTQLLFQEGKKTM